MNTAERIESIWRRRNGNLQLMAELGCLTKPGEFDEERACATLPSFQRAALTVLDHHPQDAG